MYESKGWELRRYVTLLVVLALHFALYVALMMTSRAPSLSVSTPQAVELLLLPPAYLPKIRAENPRPHRLSGGTAISITPPALDSPSESSSRFTAGSDGNGSGVDWSAEARRALQAFEIRNSRPAGSDSASGPREENWWPHAQHHAGEQYKTATGDWIVWVNSNCYRIASSASAAYAPGATLSQTVCPRQQPPAMEASREGND